MKFSTATALTVYAGTAVCAASEADAAVKSFITVIKSTSRGSMADKSTYHDLEPETKSTRASAVDTENSPTPIVTASVLPTILTVTPHVYSINATWVWHNDNNVTRTLYGSTPISTLSAVLSTSLLTTTFSDPNVKTIYSTDATWTLWNDAWTMSIYRSTAISTQTQSSEAFNSLPHATTAPHLITRVVEHEKEPASTSTSSTAGPNIAYGLDNPKQTCSMGLIKECEYHHPASVITTSFKHCWCMPTKAMPTAAS